MGKVILVGAVAIQLVLWGTAAGGAERKQETGGGAIRLGPDASGPSDRFPSEAAAGSISLWFARFPEMADVVLFVYGKAERGRARGLWLVREDRLCFYFMGWPDDLHVQVPGGVTAYQWHHAVATYDGTNARLYYDGKLLGSVATHINTAPAGKYFIGRNLTEDGREFRGEIDDVQIFARELSAEEIRSQSTQEVGKRKEIERHFVRPQLDFQEIVFAVRQADTDGHWYANFGCNIVDPNRKYYHDGGRLCCLNLATGAVRVLLADPQGGVRDPQVHYDGRRILFAYRPGGQPHYHLYEINADGTGLRQLTDGPYDDVEPTYMPNGDILFCSSRCNRWVPCYFTQVATLHRCNADGQEIRPLSANTEHENTPWPLPDGRILYQRWEYVDRSQVGYHHLWTMNPDGTGQMIYFGNLHPDTVIIDAKPIPGTRNVVASFSPGHGRTEHAGRIAVVDPGLGPDALDRVQFLTREATFRDPHPLSDNAFLVASGTTLYLLDARGGLAPLYELAVEWRSERMLVHEPRPLVPRPREPIHPERVDRAQATGRVVLEDVYAGRNMEGVKRGEIKRLLVLEILPKPYNMFSGMEPLSYGGTFLLERVLGTVPVEADGSAHVELPALRPLFFVALDENELAVKRMQSFLTVQPGETVSCVGCHDRRVETPRPGRPLLALQRGASRIESLSGIPEVFDFPRDIQPILDRHCVACHDYDASPRGGPMAGGIILSGDRGPAYSHSFYMLTIAGQFSDGRNLRKSNYPPRAIGSAASPVLKLLDGRHYGAQLSGHEQRMIRLWIDSGSVYPGTYAALGTGMIGDYSRGLDRRDLQWPSMQAAREVLQRRCATCHQGSLALPDSPSDDRNLVPWGEGPMNQLAAGRSQRKNPLFRFNRHLVYNLSRPEKSLQLLAPLARAMGGYGLCTPPSDPQGNPVFADDQDPDYQKLLAAIRVAREHLERIKRFDMAGFQPCEEYVRELQRYAILPAALSPGDSVDVYHTDQAYWQTFWCRPATRDSSNH